ncbi:MAG: hypothetical protein AAF539_12870, partial [Planctomycetota bacterium]
PAAPPNANDDPDSNRQPRLAFSIEGGGVVCRSCRAGEAGLVSVSHQALESLGELTKAWIDQPSSTELIRQRFEDAITRPSGIIIDELRELLSRILVRLLGRAPRMQPYVRALTTEKD